jgi:hypothetical protein
VTGGSIATFLVVFAFLAWRMQAGSDPGRSGSGSDSGSTDPYAGSGSAGSDSGTTSSAPLTTRSS